MVRAVETIGGIRGGSADFAGDCLYGHGRWTAAPPTDPDARTDRPGFSAFGPTDAAIDAENSATTGRPGPPWRPG
jgi:hypothetical protein